MKQGPRNSRYAPVAFCSCMSPLQRVCESVDLYGGALPPLADSFPPGVQHRRGVGGNRRSLDILPAIQRIRRPVLHPRLALSPHIFSLEAYRYSNITRLDIHGMKLPPFPSKFVKSTSPQIIQVRTRAAKFPRCYSCIRGRNANVNWSKL